jgi:sec-independent protein translocase protein TatB
MFDIGFWELALIGVVALLVVGPDRLPALARTIGLWVGRIRRYVATVRDDIEREIQADELRTMLKKPDDLNPLKDIIEETTSTIKDANREIADVEKQADDLMSAASKSKPVSGDATAQSDERGVDTPTPESAATTVAQAVSARSEAPDEAEGSGSDEGAEDTKSDEQRST